MGSKEVEISNEEINHIADLACLKLADDEIENYKKNLKEILNFVDVLNSVDTDNIKETIATFENYNRFRKDEILNENMREKLLQNAPSQDEGMFRIPKVIS